MFWYVGAELTFRALFAWQFKCKRFMFQNMQNGVNHAFRSYHRFPSKDNRKLEKKLHPEMSNMFREKKNTKCNNCEIVIPAGRRRRTRHCCRLQTDLLHHPKTKLSPHSGQSPVILQTFNLLHRGTNFRTFKLAVFHPRADAEQQTQTSSTVFLYRTKAGMWKTWWLHKWCHWLVSLHVSIFTASHWKSVKAGNCTAHLNLGQSYNYKSLLSSMRKNF